MYTLQTQLSNS